MSAPTDTRHLSLLVALEDEGSLVAAATRLHLTPSALSQQLRELEHRVGGPLFRREWRRLSPTAAGRRFIDGARVVLEELARVEDETRRLLAGAHATIRIATMCQQSYRWLPDLLEVFAESHPEVDVSVVAEAAQAPIEWLLKRKLDVALIAGELASHPHVRVAPLFRDELVAVVGRRHAWFGQRRVAPAAFADQHVIADEGALRRDTALGRALYEAGDVKPRKVTHVPMTGTVALDLARANLGITLMPRWTVESFADAGVGMVRVGARGLWLRWSLASRAEEPEKALRAFVAAMHARHPRARREPRARGGSRSMRGQRSPRSA